MYVLDHCPAAQPEGGLVEGHKVMKDCVTDVQTFFMTVPVL